MSESKRADEAVVNQEQEIMLEEVYREMQRMNAPGYMATITLNQLYENVYQSRAAIIDGLLYTGTYLFAGAPKVGKSFFMAQLAYHVSTGQKLWQYEVHPGTVLYLALEDDYQRLQERMFRMFGVEGTDRLHFAVCAKQLNSGLDEQLRQFMKEHPDTKLIIIDTLQKIREMGGDSYSYADDYQIVSRLKQFADSNGICLMIVHHTRKMPASDKFEMISGTTGLLGSADGAFILQKEKRTDDTATLDVVGRDQPDQRLYLQKDPKQLRLCVFPKDYDYNHNEPPLYAFARREDGSWDTSRPSIAFYQRLERILRRIAALGIQLDLILFHPYDRWGFAAMPQADNFRYLDYLLRRLSAMPEIWWSLANEYDLCMPKKTLADWEALEAFVASCDPYHHLLSCHNCFCFWDFKRKDVTHASIQTRALTEIPRYLREYGKPVVIDECCYEGDLPHIWGSISGQEMVRRFWRCYVGGGACTHGETFLSPDDVLWWARGGVLKGESPKRIAFLRRVIEELPGFLSPLESVWEEAERQDEAQRPDWIRPFLASLSRMAPSDRHMLLCGEHLWAAHCAEDAYLWYYGQQTAREQIIKLPPAHRYRVEALDTWNMTRETLQTGVSGRVVLTLPGREDMAVLAVRMD